MRTARLSEPPLAGYLAGFAGSSFDGLTQLHYCGNLLLLEKPLTAFFCSRRLASAEILRAYELAGELRRNRRAVIGGFHSPVERDCLKILLKGPASVVLCPARGLSPTLLRGFPADLQEPLTGALMSGRLLILTPFGPEVKRASRDTALQRNEFVKKMAAVHSESLTGGRFEERSENRIGEQYE